MCPKVSQWSIEPYLIANFNPPLCNSHIQLLSLNYVPKVYADINNYTEGELFKLQLWN